MRETTPTLPSEATARDGGSAFAATDFKPDDLANGALPDGASLSAASGPARHFAPAEARTLAPHVKTPTELFSLCHELAQASVEKQRGRLELELKLEAGDQLRVNIEWEAGQLRMVFKSESQGLRSALEQAWPAFRQEGAAAALPVAEVRFEGGSAAGQSFSESTPQRDRQQAAGSAWDEQRPSERRPAGRAQASAKSSAPNRAALWA